MINLNLISRIYDLPLQTRQWAGVLDEFATTLDAGLAGVVAYDTTSGIYKLNAMTSNFTTDLQRVYHQDIAPQSSSPFAKVAESPRRELMTELDMLDLDDVTVYKRRPAMQWLNAQFNVLYGASSQLNLSRAWSDILLVMFSEEHGPVVAEKLQLGNLYLDHFAKAVELDRAFALLRLRFDGVLTALDRFHIGIFLLSDSGSVVLKNSEANRILDQEDCLFLSREGLLRPTDETARAALKVAIARATATAGGNDDRAESTISLPRRASADPCLIEVSPLRDEHEMGEQFSGCLVFVIDPNRTDWVSTRGMKTLYGLTGAESDICRLVAEGLQTEDIAQTRNITRETVRKTIKQILHKTGTRNRAQLVRLTLNVNLPIEPGGNKT